MIRFRGVHKRFGRVTALESINLDLPAGRTIVLIGPSGCGKSTLLRLVLRLIVPSQGSVEVDGEPVNESTALQVRRAAGYVVQDGGLFPHLTARDNVALVARHLRASSDWIQARLRALCALTHFPTDGLDRFPGELSGGQRQRVGLMRALMMEPSILLLDEPLGALDPMVRARLQSELKTIFQNVAGTVLFVTHDLAEAGYIGDQIILLRAGRVVQQGTPEDFKERPADPFVTEFVEAQRAGHCF